MLKQLITAALWVFIMVAVLVAISTIASAQQTTFLNVKNNAGSTITADINDSVTSLNVQTGDGTLFPSVTFHATLIAASDSSTFEIVSVTNIATDTFTIVRAQQSTSGTAFSAGDFIRVLVTAKTITDLNTAVNNIEDGTTYIAGTFQVGNDGTVTANTAADDIVIELASGTAGGLSIMNAGTNIGAIYFGDPADDDIGRITYNHSNNEFEIINNAVSSFVIDGTTNDIRLPNGNLEVTGTSALKDNVTIGAAGAGVDYTLTVDGETSDGVLTFMEDEDRWDFTEDVAVLGGDLIVGSAALGNIGTTTEPAQITIASATAVRIKGLTTRIGAELDTTGSDVHLQFGGTNTETILWDTSESAYQVQDDLFVNGRIWSATSTQTATGPTDNVDVENVNTIFINTTSNNVTIGGFVNGKSGQVLHIAVVDITNNAVLEHNEATGNQDIFLHTGGDETLTTEYGGWTLVCNGTSWFEPGISH